MKTGSVLAAFSLAVAMFAGAPYMADAKMARPLKFLPPLLEILKKDAPTEMAVQFKALMNGPDNEKLQPFDYVSIALFLFQGANEHILKVEDALDSILLAYRKCPEATRRREIVSSANALGVNLPAYVQPVMEMIGAVFPEETDADVRIYEVTLVGNIGMRSVVARPRAQEILKRMTNDKNEAVSSVASAALKALAAAALSPEATP